MKPLIVLMLSGSSVFAAAIAGTVLLPTDRPAAGAQVALAVPGHSLYLAHAKIRANCGAANSLVVADRDGRFSLPVSDKVAVKAGETKRVTIGGTGRPVIGKFLIPPTVTNAPNRASLPPSRLYLKFSDSATNRTVDYSVQATLYGTGRGLRAKMALDGTFRVEDVTAGTWWLLADILSFPAGGGEAKTMATVGRKLIVPKMSGGRSDEPMDLGMVDPVMVCAPQISEAAPSLEVKTIGGGIFKLAEHRGQYVLLDFESMNWSGQTNQSVQAAWARFGKNDRLAMLTLSVPPAHSYISGADPEYPWPLAQLKELPWYEAKPLRARYGLQCDRSLEADPNLPAVLLVGPDGRIVAKDLHGEEIEAAIAKALGEK